MVPPEQKGRKAPARRGRILQDAEDIVNITGICRRPLWLARARLLLECNQMPGNRSEHGEGGNCISFHVLHLQPFGVK